MTKEESEMLRREIEGFSLKSMQSRIEFELVHWHVVIYRIAGQVGLIRVDLHEKDISREREHPKFAEPVEVAA